MLELGFYKKAREPKIILLIILCILCISYAMAIGCGCPYCSKNETIDLGSTYISSTIRGRVDQIQSRLIEQGVDAIGSGCGYSCIITILYKKGIIKNITELNEVVDNMLGIEVLKGSHVGGGLEEVYKGAVSQRTIYDTLKDTGFTRTGDINFDNLPEKGYSSLNEYIRLEKAKSPQSFFVIYSGLY